MNDFPEPPETIRAALHAGIAIPAHPLAVTNERRFDERRQRALTRYYHAAGSGGLAVGVHTTQFEIREPRHGLYIPVLELAARTAAECDADSGRRTVMIAGICGTTAQAVNEAGIACSLGYHAGLLSLAALSDAGDDALIRHCVEIARVIPLVGFYLQPAVGGRILSADFWRRFAGIPSVAAIKIAPFNRYHTLDVVRGVAESGRAGEIALYTGNDDNIVPDLLSEFSMVVADGKIVQKRIVGGLLGHWACQTRGAVELLRECRALRERDGGVPREMFARANQITDCNAAFFDVANGFAGSISGIHEVLRRQGLLANAYCLNPRQALSPGQAERIDRVLSDYPHLTDDEFIAEHIDEWIS